MSNYQNFLTRSSCMAGLMVASTAAVMAVNVSDASAQPSPFDAYEGKKQVEQTQSGTQSTTTQVQQAPAKCDCKKAEANLYSHTGKGQVVLDLRSTLSTTFSSNETAADGTIKNSTFFGRISPGVGYFIRPNLEVGGSVGLMWRRIARDASDSSTSRDLLMEARGRYHYHLTQRFTLIPGVTLGGYIGNSTRSTPLNTTTNVEERTRTYGGAATLSLDWGYVLKDNLALNAGIGVIGLLGAEKVDALDDSFRVTTVNGSVNLGLVYAF